ncbi:MAG: hypothetical protein BWY24_00012 [Microgenomates group bacterium ADurb.Bin219]|nr:MAG: hypothetical protein BWY24_00012 [Microgenomates group bacterium ADurb.Bin219]HNP89274.1 fibronectin type III domain-containing protein [Candidatus Woesebacteria bacterium]
MKKIKIDNHLKKNLLGFGAILIGLGGLLFLIQNPTIFRSQAAPEPTPKEVKLTNLSENSLTVSWLTDFPTKGLLFYSESNDLLKKQVAFDDRPSQPSSKIHHITLKDLYPGKTYYFLLVSGEERFDNNGRPYEFTTPATPAATPLPPFILKGRILNTNQMPANEVLVYFSFNNSTPISTLTDKNGNYLLNLNNSRNKDRATPYLVQMNEKGYLLVADGETTVVKPIVVQDNQTLTDITLTASPKETNAETESTLKSPPSFETQLWPASPVEEKENWLTKIIKFFKRIFSFNKKT